MNKEQLTKIILRLENAKRISGDIIDMPLKHVCSKEFCNPENEQDLISKGFLNSPAQSSNVYLCKYKCHHICDKFKCNNIVLGVCAITGACYGNPGGYSNYDKNNSRTWHTNFRSNEYCQQIDEFENPSIFNKQISQPEAIVQKKRKKTSFKKLLIQYRITAQLIVTSLLYSPIREKINNATNKNNLKILAKKTQSYIKACEKQRNVVNIIHLMMLNDTYKSVNCKLEILNYDEHVINKYTNIIIETYKNVKKYYTESFKFETIALGTLYEMRQGYKIEQIQLFPSDSFLLHNLPIINDIPSFGFDKKYITKGKQIIQYAYGRAIELGVSIQDLIII